MVMGETEEIIGRSMITFDKTRMTSIEQGHPRNSGVTACQDSKQCMCISSLELPN